MYVKFCRSAHKQSKTTASINTACRTLRSGHVCRNSKPCTPDAFFHCDPHDDDDDGDDDDNDDDDADDEDGDDDNDD
eukprot:4980792-Karenia_brevis.AAC.1